MYCILIVVPKMPVALIASATTSSTIAMMSVQPNACPTGDSGSSSAVAVARSHLAEAGVDASAFEASAHPETGLRRPLQQSQAAFAKSTSSARFGAHVAAGLGASGEQLSHSGTLSSTSSKATVLMRISEDNWPSRSNKYFEMLLQQRKVFLGELSSYAHTVPEYTLHVQVRVYLFECTCTVLVLLALNVYTICILISTITIVGFVSLRSLYLVNCIVFLHLILCRAGSRSLQQVRYCSQSHPLHRRTTGRR